MTTAPANSTRKTLALAAVLAALVIASYLPTLGNQYIWDDDDYIKDQFELRQPGGLERIWTHISPPVTPQYYPMVFTTFWLEHRFWDSPDKPSAPSEPNWFGYHLDNMILHLANALLLWLVLRKLKLPAAWLAAAIFAVHPIEVESVAWASERKNVLCLLFYLLAALCYIKADSLTPDSAFSPELAPKKSGKPNHMMVVFWLVLTLLCYICALFSKTVTSTFPAAVLVMTWWKRGTITRRDVLWAVPMICVGARMMFLTATVESDHVGAFGREWNFTTIDRVLIAGRALWFYAAKIIWPHPLVFIYPQWKIDPAQLWQWLFPIGAVAVPAALLLWRKRIGRGPLAAALFFAGTLFPALGFVNLFPMRYSFVADHFQYVAGISLIVLVAIGLDRLGRQFIRAAVARGAVVTILLLGLGVLTFQQCFVYYDRATLWLDTVTKDDNSWIGWTDLAALVTEHPHLPEQIDFLKKAISISLTSPPADKDLQACLADPSPESARRRYLSLLHARPDLDDPVDTYAQLAFVKKAVAVAPDRPLPHDNLAHALLNSDPAGAEGEYLVALHLNPDLPEGLDDYATLLAQQGRYQEALDRWNHLVEIYSEGSVIEAVYAKMGLAHDMLNQPDAALADYGSAAYAGQRYGSVFGTLRLADAFAKRGRMNEALAQLQTAAQMQPEVFEAQLSLGQMLAVLHRFPEAQPHLLAALAISPRNVDAHSVLANVYLATQQLDNAMKEFQILAALDSKNPEWPKKIEALQRVRSQAPNPGS